MFFYYNIIDFVECVARQTRGAIKKTPTQAPAHNIHTN